MGEGVTGFQDYRDFLKAELETRLCRNPRYSLRAFARDLKVAPQNLSQIFRKKKGISLDSAAKISARLGLGAQESEYFCDLVALAHSRSADSRRIASIRLAKYETESPYQELREDVFRAISDWYHFAILELTYVRDFQSSPAWIAKTLGISLHQAKQGISRLKRLGLLEQKGRTLKKTTTNIGTTNGVPSSSVRMLTQQLLQKAIDSLSLQSVDERDTTTMTLAIDPSKIPAAKEMIRRFRRKLTTFLENGSREEVYCFASQLFRISNQRGDQS